MLILVGNIINIIAPMLLYSFRLLFLNTDIVYCERFMENYDDAVDTNLTVSSSSSDEEESWKDYVDNEDDYFQNNENPAKNTDDKNKNSKDNKEANKSAAAQPQQPAIPDSLDKFKTFVPDTAAKMMEKATDKLSPNNNNPNKSNPKPNKNNNQSVYGILNQLKDKLNELEKALGK